MTTPAQRYALPGRSGKLAPWPIDEQGVDNRQLDIQAKIQTSTGWMDLEDRTHYAIHAESFAESAVSYRNRQVENDFVEGSYTVTSVRANVKEPVVIWVKGATHYEWRYYIDKLTDALEQLSWQFMVRIEDATEYWNCMPSDYSIQTQREFIHARLAIVRATVERLPTKTLVYANAGET